MDQKHLFESWKVEDEEKIHGFFQQIAVLNTKYPGGLTAYRNNAIDLLKRSQQGVNPFEGYTPKIPQGDSLEAGSAKFLEAERVGLAAMKQTSFVMVAGGLGERLGYGGIKIELPCDTVTGKPFLQLYIEYLLAYQARTCAAGEKVHLAIMTSGDTHEKTVKLLESNNNFGMEPGQLDIIKQEKVPSLCNNNGKFLTLEGNAYELDTKPHGHGDVHSLLFTEKILEKWNAAGKKWVVFFQDTNALVFKSLLAAVGVSVQNNFDVNSLTVPRTAGEAAGAIVCLEHTDGHSVTTNVEYNQLGPMLKATTGKGDEGDANGFSPYPGNINVLVFGLPSYLRVLERTGGQIPEFVNPKYSNPPENTEFTKPTRLECMMQDYPHLLKDEKTPVSVGFTQLDRWISFSAVKNNIVDAAKKAKSNLPPECASSGEMDLYAASCKCLKSAGVTVPEPEKQTWAGVDVPVPPKVHISPSTAVTWGETLERFKPSAPGAISLTPSSTLVTTGDVTIKSLTLDGALYIEAAPGARVVVDGLKVTNKGCALKAVDPNDTSIAESMRIRGYVCEKGDCEIKSVTAAGETVLSS
eukprot:JP435690.1.p1 GENE.JP435690.1~~JP435690.1.p1  ORF type:complete len:598 (-),score=237.10 JP435690.1:235-1974(-)